MKTILLLSLFFSTQAYGAEWLILSCKDFEHSDTSEVQVIAKEDGTGRVVEIMSDESQTERDITAEELAAEEFKISPIFNDFERTIKRAYEENETGWVIGYSCGEERQLTCEEFE